MKELDLRKTVAELVKQYPEVKEIMVDLGFKDITSPIAMKFMGKVMTIPKGAAIKGIPMDRIIAAFEENGFHITGVPGHEEIAVSGTAEDRNTKLKKLIQRLNQGENLESVRADLNCTPFVRQVWYTTNKWGDLSCQRGSQTRGTHQNSSKRS
ncbi:MAG: DUF1858 domain-containing protein, partial [Clostridia bacterium]|nr:DUF1858 domain-containing protein [Clostridia bacterium]